MPLIATGCAGYKIDPSVSEEDEVSLRLNTRFGEWGEITITQVNEIKLPEEVSNSHVSLEIPKGETTIELICHARTPPKYKKWPITATNKRKIKFTANAGEDYFLSPVLISKKYQYTKESLFLTCNETTGQCWRNTKQATGVNANCGIRVYSFPTGFGEVNTEFQYLISSDSHQ